MGRAWAEGPAGAVVDGCALLAVPVVLVAGAVTDGPWALIALVVVGAVLALMALRLETLGRDPASIVAVAVMAALGAAGRVALAAIPDVKPLSAIIIVSGAELGPRAGFAVGALGALASNIAMGQGSWTPWQMYAWGLMGYAAGHLARRGLLAGRAQALAFGALSCMVFGALMDGYVLVSYVRPVTWASAISCWLASIPFDVVHALATVGFLLVIWVPWRRRLSRMVAARHLSEPGGR